MAMAALIGYRCYLIVICFRQRKTHNRQKMSRTKLIMDIEKCDYEMETGIGVGLNAPTKTPHRLHWKRLEDERNHRRGMTRRQNQERKEKSRRKQQNPRNTVY